MIYFFPFLLCVTLSAELDSSAAADERTNEDRIGGIVEITAIPSAICIPRPMLVIAKASRFTNPQPLWTAQLICHRCAARIV
jgi:hypothetical protein